MQCFLHIPHGDIGMGIGICGAHWAGIGAHPTGICGAQAAPMHPTGGAIGAHPGCGAHGAGIGGAHWAGIGAHPTGICGAQAAPMHPTGGAIGAHPAIGMHGSTGAQAGAGIHSNGGGAPTGGHSSQIGFGGGGGGRAGGAGGAGGGGAIPKNSWIC